MQSGALIRLADLRVRQGRFEEAEQLLEGLDVHAEAARPLGAVYLARGEHDLAASVVERAIAQHDPESTAAGGLWAFLFDVNLERGAIDDAVSALEKIDAVAAKTKNDYIAACAALARGRLCLATGTGDPNVCLQEALAGFAKVEVPLELARTRLELARAMTEGRPEVAIAEAKAAFDSFERLRAARQADEAAALLRKLGGPARTGPKGAETLTKRESEVLELLGHGLSNPEISDRLYISRKTVEHHVGNVLAKLGLRSRAEAAAYAARNPAAT
jgi:DNA-binding CsgD family transcriptional regulator